MQLPARYACIWKQRMLLEPRRRCGALLQRSSTAVAAADVLVPLWQGSGGPGL